MKQYKLHSPE